METYFKLYTRFLNWEWYTDIPVKTLFLHCLLKANYKEKTCFGEKIGRGQFVTSIAHLASETGLTVQQVRTAIEKLKKTKNITSSSTSRNTVITVLNWDKYHTEQQTNNKRITTTNNGSIGTISSNPSYSNNTHTNNVCVNLSKEDREILAYYARKSNARNIDAYVNSLIKNGGYAEILLKEKGRQQKLREREDQLRQQLEDITKPKPPNPEEEAEIAAIQKRIRERWRK